MYKESPSHVAANAYLYAAMRPKRYNDKGIDFPATRHF